MKLIICFFFCILLTTGCQDKIELWGKGEKVAGRFDIIDEFYMFDTYSKAGMNGRILRDRITKQCFLHYRFGSANGGAAMVNIDCKD